VRVGVGLGVAVGMAVAEAGGGEVCVKVATAGGRVPVAVAGGGSVAVAGGGGVAVSWAGGWVGGGAVAGGGGCGVLEASGVRVGTLGTKSCVPVMTRVSVPMQLPSWRAVTETPKAWLMVEMVSPARTV
jgi:hypothetical protein